MKKTSSASPYPYPLVAASAEKIQKTHTLMTGKNAAPDRLSPGSLPLLQNSMQ